jgi:hypothetical protein
MADPAEQLKRLAEAGFDFQTFDRYPKAVGVVRGDCIALMEYTPAGLQMIGRPGWRMGEVLGVLTTVKGRQVFQAKQEVLEATPERVAALRRFEKELQAALISVA